MAPSKITYPKNSPNLNLMDRQLDETNSTAAALPNNEEKAAEYSVDNALNPEEGTQIEPPSPLVTSSTLSENMVSKKTGQPAAAGKNASNGSLECVPTPQVSE